MSVNPETCAHWHPNEPPQIKVAARSEGGVQEVCMACGRARAKAKYWNKNAPLAPGHFPASRMPYGVLPRLTWPAPEFLLRQ